MNSGRVALIVSCVVVAALGIWFAVARWDDANKVAVVVSALAAVAAVGVSVWTVLRAPRSRASLVVSDTGEAIAGTGGQAVTGISGTADGVDGSIRVERTGDAKARVRSGRRDHAAAASGDGDAVTGVHLD